MKRIFFRIRLWHYNTFVHPKLAKQQEEEYGRIRKKLQITVCRDMLLQRLRNPKPLRDARFKKARRRLAALKSAKLPLHKHVGAVDDAACRHGDYARLHLRLIPSFEGQKYIKVNGQYRVFDCSESAFMYGTRQKFLESLKPKKGNA